MDINWLPGGPYYEVSFIAPNIYDSEAELNNLIDKFSLLNYNIEMREDDPESRIKSFYNGNDFQIALNIHINIRGKQRSKIYIEYLSDEIIQVDFCFLEEKLNKSKIKRLKDLLSDSMELYGGIAGIIGCETDCRAALFETREPYPHKDYSTKKLKRFTNEDIKNNPGWFSGVEEIVWRG